MEGWAGLSRWVHLGLVLLTSLAAFGFLIRTRFWFPKYVHWLGVVALGVGLSMVTMIPADAPINAGEWVALKKILFVFLFPAIVYVAFVFYGGQRAAYDARRIREGSCCPHCGETGVLPAEACSACGQIVPPSPGGSA